MHLQEEGKKQDTALYSTEHFTLSCPNKVCWESEVPSKATQSSLTAQHMVASTRKQAAAHLQYRSVSNPQTPAPAPKGPHV